MKRLIVSVIIAMVCGIWACAQQVRFAWDQPAVQPSGYELRLSETLGGPVVKTVDCGPAINHEYTAKVDRGTWHAQLFAYNAGDPDFLKQYSSGSNVVKFTLPTVPAIPANMRIERETVVEIRFTMPDESEITVNAEVK